MAQKMHCEPLSIIVMKNEARSIFYGPQDPSERLSMLQNGKVRILRSTPDWREFTLAVVESGTVFGEMALIGQQMEDAYAQAMEPSQKSRKQ
jgi:CRP/FNR family cyclic AMP-dependent transcriptional regulator